MDQLIQIDKWLFLWINYDWSNGVFDYLCPILREAKTWIPMYVILFGFIIYKWRKNGLILVAFMIMTVGLTDVISSDIVKKTVKRPRPCHVFSDHHMISRVHCGSGFSFTSSHATNHFGLAWWFSFLFIGKFKRLAQVGFYTWAGTIAFSQVYVGVHYPIDVIVGAILGISLSKLVYEMYKFTVPKHLKIHEPKMT